MEPNASTIIATLPRARIAFNPETINNPLVAKDERVNSSFDYVGSKKT
jgi:hypothetical protein